MDIWGITDFQFPPFSRFTKIILNVAHVPRNRDIQISIFQLAISTPTHTHSHTENKISPLCMRGIHPAESVCVRVKTKYISAGSHFTTNLSTRCLPCQKQTLCYTVIYLRMKYGGRTFYVKI